MRTGPVKRNHDWFSWFKLNCRIILKRKAGWKVNKAGVLELLLLAAKRALLQLLSLTISASAQSPPSDSQTDNQRQFQDFSGHIEQFPTRWPGTAAALSVNSSMWSMALWSCLWCGDRRWMYCGDRGDVWPHRLQLKLRSLEKCATLLSWTFKTFSDLNLIFNPSSSIPFQLPAYFHSPISHGSKWKVWTRQLEPTEANFFAGSFIPGAPFYNSTQTFYKKIHGHSYLKSIIWFILNNLKGTVILKTI